MDILLILAAVGGVLLSIAIIHLVTAVVLAMQVYSLSISRFVPLKKLTLTDKQHLLFLQADAWAKRHGFHYVGIFRFQILCIAAWENPERCTFLGQYLSFNGPFYEIDTNFDDNLAVCTGNVRDGALFPMPPSNYTQQFPKKSLEELWELHLEAQRYLEETGNARLTPYSPKYPWGNVAFGNEGSPSMPTAMEIVQNSGVRTQAKYVRSLFLWPLRWPYWYFYRRFFWVNKTIQEQIKMDRLVLPQELPPDYQIHVIPWLPKPKKPDGFAPLERQSLFAAEEDKEDEEDMEPWYPSALAPKPQPPSWLAKNCRWGCVVYSIIVSAIIPLCFWVVDRKENNTHQQVIQALAREDFDTAMDQTKKFRRDWRRDRALQDIAMKLASVERYDEAMRTAELIQNDWRKTKVSQDVIFIKTAAEQFGDLTNSSNENLMKSTPIIPLNYDEAEVPKFELPDPLETLDGHTVNTPELWNTVRRPELLSLFEEEMYGKPPFPIDDLEAVGFSVAVSTSVSDPNVFDGKGTRHQIRLQFVKQGEQPKDDDPKIDVLIYTPNNVQGKVPAFLGLNFRGNHTVSTDPGIKLGTVWVRPEGSRDGWDGVLVPQSAKEEDRGSMARRWSIEMILDRGYAVATAYYCDIEPDFDGGIKYGVRRLIDQEGEPAPNEAGTIATWAWGLRIIRNALCEREHLNIDPERIAVLGHSRLGKTALWAGATDPKFAMVVSNNSGCGGAAVYRREYGETLLLLNVVRPHWFCGNFKKYNDDVLALPFDQHELVALIAPRPVYIASAEEDKPADPKGEFLAGLYADPVYRLLGTDGISSVTTMPEVNRSVGGTIGYHIRTGKHDIIEYDWEQFLNFADTHLRYPPVGREL